MTFDKRVVLHRAELRNLVRIMLSEKFYTIGSCWYRGTSLIRNRRLLGPCRSPVPRGLVKTVTWLANAMQQTAIEEPRVLGGVVEEGERAVKTVKTAATFERGFTTPCRACKTGFTLRL